MSTYGAWGDIEDLEAAVADVKRWDRDRVIAAVATVVDETGLLSRNAAVRLSEESGWSARHLWRLSRQHQTPEQDPEPAPHPNVTFLDRIEADGPSAFEFDELALTMLYLCGGNRSLLRRELLTAGYEMPSEATVCRAWKRVPLPVRDGARHGHRRRYRNLLYLRTKPPEHANEAWEIDDFDFDLDLRILIPDPTAEDLFLPEQFGNRVEVTRPGAWMGIRPHLTAIGDKASRFIVGWMLLDHTPTSEDVAALFADAFEVREPEDGTDGFIGGHCPLVVCDNASYFTSYASQDLFVGFQTNVDPAFSYQPHQKGMIERLGQTLQSMIVTGLPGLVSPAETMRKQGLFDVDAEHWLEFSQLEKLVAQKVYEYNYRRPHSALGGKTPAEVYLASNTAPTSVPDEVLAARYLPVHRKDGERIVQPTGVSALGQWWTDPAFGRTGRAPSARIGDNVRLRRLHHRLDRLAVFTTSDEFVTMVRPSHALDKEDYEEIRAQRRDAAHRINKAAARTREAMAIRGDGIAAGTPVSMVEAAKQAVEARAAKAAGPVKTTKAKKRTGQAKAKQPGGVKPATRAPRQSKKAAAKKPPATTATSRPDLDLAEQARQRRATARKNGARSGGSK